MFYIFPVFVGVIPFGLSVRVEFFHESVFYSNDVEGVEHQFALHFLFQRSIVVE